MNEHVKDTLNHIIFYLKRINHEKNEDYYLGNNHYLLGQMLRQIKLPLSKYYVSEAAYKLWHQITDDDMMNYWYNTKVIVKFDDIELEI